MYLFVALMAYVTDAIFGEFRFIRHPVIWMGDFIGWFEQRFYADTKRLGCLLTLTLTVTALVISLPFAIWLPPVVQGVAASTLLAHRMLHDSVRDAIGSREKLSMLVSRDTENLSESEINKALVETYAENLSDGVIAPLFYLVLFGLPGIVVYKAINTLDSMVGYKTARYRNFGYCSARLDDVANFIPARLTALLILLLCQKGGFMKLHRFAKGHASPNAGYPISAAALSFGLKLGGATSYHGKMVAKPWFGEGREEIEALDVLRVLEMRKRVDLLLISLLVMGTIVV